MGTNWTNYKVAELRFVPKGISHCSMRRGYSIPELKYSRMGRCKAFFFSRKKVRPQRMLLVDVHAAAKLSQITQDVSLILSELHLVP
jgi:hypothetical protein